MAVGPSAAFAEDVLDALLNQTNLTAPTALHMQLHVGDPGAAGTSNVATETDRVEVTSLFSAASGGTCTNSGDITWEGVAAAEDYTHYTLWSASTSGTFYFSGEITANAVAVSDDFTIKAGELDFTFGVAS